MPTDPTPKETQLPEGPEYHYVQARWLPPQRGKVTRGLKLVLLLSALVGLTGAVLFVRYMAQNDGNPPTWMFALALTGLGLFSTAGYAALWQLNHNYDRD